MSDKALAKAVAQRGAAIAREITRALKAKRIKATPARIAAVANTAIVAMHLGVYDFDRILATARKLPSWPEVTR